MSIEDKELQSLLGALEHAGRDQRRRQQLSDLIDGLAAKEAKIASSPKRVPLWRKPWVIATSIAASLLLVIGIGLRLGMSSPGVPASSPAPSGGNATIVAATHPDELSTHNTADNLSSPVSTNPNRGCAGEDADAPSDIDAPAINSQASLSDEEFLLAETIENEPTDGDTVEEEQADGDTTKEMELPDSQTPIAEAPLASNPTTIPAEKPAKPKRPSFFQRHRAAPSKMDGTMLALRLM